MLVSKAIPALYGGVSQQPDTMRSLIQLASMVNSWSTVVDGIGKRPPSEHVAMIAPTPLEDAYLHTINRDITERYIVTIVDGDLKVHGLDGTAYAVTFPHGKGYLDVPNGSTARETFACVTVADYTFVLNKTVVVEQGPLNSDRTGQPVNYYDLNRAPGAGGAQQFQYPPNPSLGTYHGVVQTFQDLPETASEGATYKIQSTVESGFSGYYVRRTEGTWIEVTRPGAINAMDATTLPWALVRLGDGSFEFCPFSWAPRRVGDETTNPGPSFLGRTLNDIFFANNRLGLTVDENMVMSRAGDFGNFWRMSSIDLFDDDVVDVAATETKVTKLLYAVPMAGDVMLFADQVQFRFDTGDFLTPSSGSLKPTTQYPTVPLVRPAALGSDVYFASEEGDWARLYEYYVREESSERDAADVAGHVPRYIPAGVRDVATSSTHDAVFLVSKGAKNRVYHYKFYWASDSEKAQSAWGYWELNPTDSINAIECIGDYLYMVVVRPSGTFIERVNLSSTAVAPGLPFEVYLDRRASVTGTYDSVGDRTYFDLPYSIPTDRRQSLQVVRGGEWPAGKGGLLDPSQAVWIDVLRVAYPGNLTAHPVFVGEKYTQRWTFSKWFMTGRNGEPDLTGRLQIRTVTLYHTRAGYFKTEVAPYGTAPEIESVVPAKLAEFTGKTLGDDELLVGDPAFSDGAYSFQVYGNAGDAVISISNDSHLGAWFTSAEVEFFWQKRSRFA
jgi:hypothetical protein